MKNKNFRVKLGDKVRDSITGYEGVCTSIARFLNGCRRIGIQGNKLDKDNLPVDSYVVDETTVQVIEKKIFKTVQEDNGGPNERISKFKAL